jgi:tetratricopeptide (TPR) repeat protein
MRLALLLSALVTALALLTAPPVAEAQTREARIARARELFGEGIAAYDRGELHVAAEKLLAAQRSWRSPDIAFNIARCFERMGEAPRAIHWFRVYLEHGRPDEATRRDIERRMQAMQELQDRQANQTQAGRPTQAELAGESRRLFEQGLRFYERRQYQVAYEAFQSSCSALAVAQGNALGECDNAELSYNLARTAERLERWGEARLHYRKFLRLAPRSPERANVERRMRELEELAH